MTQTEPDQRLSQLIKETVHIKELAGDVSRALEVSNATLRVLQERLDGLRERRANVAVELRVLLSYLRDRPRVEWEMPMYRQTMKGYAKIGEIRFICFKTQFRVFGFFGPSNGSYTLLGGATEKMRRYNPADAIESADKQRERVLNGERTIEQFDVSVTEQTR